MFRLGTRSQLTTGTASLVLALALAAHPASAQSTANPAGVDQASGAAESEIVVTALRRDSKLLDTPASVSVLGAAMIEQARITRPADFAIFVPNMSITQSNRAGEAFVTIRGIAQARQADATVAVIVDGVQQGSAEELNQELFDIKQIEVLKGPQGALYGRNAIGGAIVITTQPPPEDFHASASVSYGNISAIRAVGTVSIPVVADKVYLRVSGYHNENDGFYRNIVNGRKVDPSSERGGRVRLDVQLTDEFSLDLRAALTHFDGSGINYLPQFGVLDVDNTSRNYNQNIPGVDKQNKRNFSLTMKYETPEGVISFTPSYSRVIENLTADAFPYDFSASNTQSARFYTRSTTGELKFTSAQDRRFTYIVGAYGADIKRQDTVATGQDTGQGVVFPVAGAPYGATSQNPTLALQNDRYHYKVYAVFAQAGLSITDQLQLSAAMRYDHEKRETVNVTPAAFSAFSGNRRNKTFEGFEPKVTLSYKITPQVNLYADYSQGFVSGGFNPAQTEAILQAADPNSTTPNEYGKQTSKAFEAGIKTDLLSHRLTLNAAYFRTKVKNLQQFQFFPAATLQAINPIDGAKIDGFEADLTYRMSPALTLFAGAGYTNARISKILGAPALKGNRTPYVPRYTANGGIQYQQDLGGDVDGSMRVDYQRVGPQNFDIANTPGSRRSAIDLVNARIALSRGQWQIAAFSKNLFNEKYNVESIVVTPNVQLLYPAPLRTYGIELKVNF